MDSVGIYILYIYICKIHILLVVKFKFKAKLLQFPDALTFFGGVAKVPNSYSIMSNHHSKNVVLHVCVLFVSFATILLQKKNLSMQTSRDLFCKASFLKCFLWQLPIVFDLQFGTFSIIDLSTWNVSPRQVRLKRLSPMRAWKLSHGGGESSDNHKNNSSKLSEDVFLWTELATVGKTTFLNIFRIHDIRFAFVVTIFRRNMFRSFWWMNSSKRLLDFMVPGWSC